MTTIAKQRPGIYSDYQTSGVLYSKKMEKRIAIIAQSEAEPNTLYSLQKLVDAKTVFGEASAMYALYKAVLENGAGSIVGVSVRENTSAAYEAAFKLIAGTDGIGVVICDSTDLAIQQLLAQSVVEASQNKRERIGILAADSNESNLAAWANKFNSERILLVAQSPINSQGEELYGCILSAAMAAIISQYTDPSQSFNGAGFENISKLSKDLSEAEVDEYITNGIIPFEVVAGRVEVIRAVTSKTTTDGIADKTFKELNTILIIDEVIKAVRETLRENISTAKKQHDHKKCNKQPSNSQAAGVFGCKCYRIVCGA